MFFITSNRHLQQSVEVVGFSIEFLCFNSTGDFFRNQLNIFQLIRNSATKNMDSVYPDILLSRHDCYWVILISEKTHNADKISKLIVSNFRLIWNSQHKTEARQKWYNETWLKRDESQTWLFPGIRNLFGKSYVDFASRKSINVMK